MNDFMVDDVHVSVFDSRSAMGRAAAKEAAELMKHLLEQRSGLRMVFAAAPSQDEFLDALVEEQGIDWRRITAFHMDEYIGLPTAAPQRFAHYLDRRLFLRVPFAAVHRIDGAAADPGSEAVRYGTLLCEQPIDIVCMGIGENGHIAFNDPPVANFTDPETVKSVELDDACRQQQVNDGCFDSVELVPTHALTLTVPALLGAASLFIMVPGERKARAVKRALYGDISTDCPASILRRHHHARLYLDPHSASALPPLTNTTTGLS